VELLGNDVRAERICPELVEFILGPTRMPWGWEYRDALNPRLPEPGIDATFTVSHGSRLDFLPREGTMLPTLLAAGLLISAGPAPSPSEARAFPTYVLIRGGTLKEPVLIHAKPSHPVRGLRGIITYIPVATLVGMQDDLLPQPTAPGVVVYEVAEYWGLWGMVDSTGRPNATLRWDGASQYSRLHVMQNGDVLWQALEGQFQGARLAYQRLMQPAIEVLAEFGIPLPPQVPRFDPRATAAQLAGCWDARQRRRYGTGELGAGLPARLVLEAGPVDAEGRRPLLVPAEPGSQQHPARGTWIFGRADMVIASIPGPDGVRNAHLSFTDLPGALRGTVEVPATAAVPSDFSADYLELVRAKCP